MSRLPEMFKFLNTLPSPMESSGVQWTPCGLHMDWARSQYKTYWLLLEFTGVPVDSMWTLYELCGISLHWVYWSL